MGIFDRSPADPMAEINAKLETLTQSVEKLTTGFQTLHQTQTQMQQEIGAVRQEFGGIESQFQHVATHERSQEQQAEQVRGLHEYSPEELELMSEQDKWRVQSEYQEARMRESIKNAVNPIGEQFSTFQQQSAQDKARMELDAVMKEVGPDGKLLRPDFKDMLQTMVELKKDPARANLPFSELYDLSHGHVKRTQPERYAALQEKHFPKPENMRQPYGGFLSDTSQQSDEPGDMSIPDAAQAAANEVLEEIGSFPSADSMGDLPS